MLPMLVGTALAVLGLLFVLMPLLRGARVLAAAAPSEPAEGASAIEALREIEFDRATGKLSAEDHASLRATYAPMALAELEAREMGVRGAAPDAAGETDAAERLIAQMKARTRTCPHCGPRPEGDAIFCSDCGRFIAGTCLRCGAAVGSPHARFCGECGSSLAG